MGFGCHCVTSLRWCYSTEDYNEYINNHLYIIDNEKIFADWFFLPYCDGCKNIESLQITCVHIN